MFADVCISMCAQVPILQSTFTRYFCECVPWETLDEQCHTCSACTCLLTPRSHSRPSPPVFFLYEWEARIHACALMRTRPSVFVPLLHPPFLPPSPPLLPSLPPSRPDTDHVVIGMLDRDGLNLKAHHPPLIATMEVVVQDGEPQVIEQVDALPPRTQCKQTKQIKQTTSAPACTGTRRANGAGFKKK